MPHLEDHPYSELFPLMGDSDLAALADDIEANGLRDPVYLFEGKILDGRNRYRACVLKGIDQKVERYTGEDPIGFVVSKNLHRRHMTESQRAMAAADIAKMGRGRPESNGVHAPHLTTTQAAGLLHVSPETVKDAKSVQTHGVPELADAVRSGDVSVSAAAEVAKLPKSEQKKAVKDKKVKETAAKVRADRKPKTRAASSNPEKVSEPGATTSGPSNNGSAKTKPAPEPAIKDGLGNVVPRCVADTFGDPMLTDAVARIDAVHKELVSIEHHVATVLSTKGEFWPYAQFGECCKSLKDAVTSAGNASNQLFIGVPFCVCPKCRGEGCKDCRNSGAWNRHRHEQRAQYGDA